MGEQIILNSYMTADIRAMVMPMIIIFKSPSDFQGKYVARLFKLGRPTIIAVVKDTLPEIRMAIPRYMVRLPRRQKDDPKIIETWI